MKKRGLMFLLSFIMMISIVPTYVSANTIPEQQDVIIRAVEIGSIYELEGWLLDNPHADADINKLIGLLEDGERFSLAVVDTGDPLSRSPLGRLVWVISGHNTTQAHITVHNVSFLAVVFSGLVELWGNTLPAALAHRQMNAWLIGLGTHVEAPISTAGGHAWNAGVIRLQYDGASVILFF